MADETTTVEKHYCYPTDHSNNSALWAALMNKENSSPIETAALMNGGMNGMWNNPMMYIMYMWLFRYMNGWGDGTNPNSEALNYNNRQISELRTIVDNNHNVDLTIQAIQGNGAAIHELANTFNTDFNTMSQAICGVKSAIESVGANVGFSAERVINAVNSGDANIVNAVNTSACGTQKAILEMGYQNQLGNMANTNAIERQTGMLGSRIDAFQAADQLQTCQQTNALKDAVYQSTNAIVTGLTENRQAVYNGFSNLGYTLAQDTCAILQGQKDSTNAITSLLQNHWQAETSQALQDAKFEISQQKQNNYIATLLNGGCACNAS